MRRTPSAKAKQAQAAQVEGKAAKGKSRQNGDALGLGDLDALERLHVRQAHPPPASIDFRGAT